MVIEAQLLSSGNSLQALERDKNFEKSNAHIHSTSAQRDNSTPFSVQNMGVQNMGTYRSFGALNFDVTYQLRALLKRINFHDLNL